MRTLALVLTILLSAPIAQAFTPAVDATDSDDDPVYPYHTWETLTVRLQELVAANPDIARLHSAGKSVMGLDLWVVEIANFDDPDRIPLEDREVVWLDGGTHAREQLGMMMAHLWVEYLLGEYGTNDTATWIVDNRHTYIMPMVNPDGNHLDSRTNARMVNINRNYPVGWGAVDERIIGNYPGPYAASEPETQVVIDWVKKVQPDYFNSFHTGVDMMLYPYGYHESLPADNAVFARICEELGETDPEFCGPIYHTIYPASGNAVDFAYTETGAIAWTYEVSEEAGLYWSLEDPKVRMNRYWVGVEHAFLNTEKYGGHLSLLEIRVPDADAEAPRLELVLENDGYGPARDAEIAVSLDGGRTHAVRVGDVAPESRIVVPVTLEAATAGANKSLDVRLAYAKRLVATSPVEDVTISVPADVRDDRLTLQSLDGTPVLDLSSERLEVPFGLWPLLSVLGVALARVKRRAR